MTTRPQGETEPDARTLAAIQAVMGDEAPSEKPARPADRFDPLADPEPARTGRVHAAIARLKAWRPTRRQMLWTGFAIVVILRPWWVFGPLILAVLLVGGLFLGLGPERFWDGAMARLDRFVRRWPERGARLVARLDRLAERWDRICAPLPEAWAEALALPSFADYTERQAAHQARVDERLKRLDGGPGDDGLRAG